MGVMFRKRGGQGDLSVVFWTLVEGGLKRGDLSVGLKRRVWELKRWFLGCAGFGGFGVVWVCGGVTVLGYS